MESEGGTLPIRCREGGTVLVLGGGGARGLAHFGVLRVLERYGIKIDRIVGVSIGSFAGAVYAQSPNAEDVIARIREYITSPKFTSYYRRMTSASKKARSDDRRNAPESYDVPPEAPESSTTDRWIGRLKQMMGQTMALSRVVFSRAILSHRPMEDCLESIAKPGKIEDLAIPLTIVAADLRRGRRVDLEHGDLFSAILGSTALPAIFPPIEREQALLADYGVVCSMPVPTAMRYRPEHIIAVDLSQEIRMKHEFGSGLEILNRVEEIGGFLFKEHVAQYADVIIRPRVSHIDWADFADMDPIVAEGERATEAVGHRLIEIKASQIACAMTSPATRDQRVLPPR